MVGRTTGVTCKDRYCSRLEGKRLASLVKIVKAVEWQLRG